MNVSTFGLYEIKKFEGQVKENGFSDEDGEGFKEGSIGLILLG